MLHIYLYAQKSLPSIADCTIMSQESFNIEMVRKYHQDIANLLKKNIIKNNGSIKMHTTNYYIHQHVQVPLALLVAFQLSERHSLL